MGIIPKGRDDPALSTLEAWARPHVPRSRHRIGHGDYVRVALVLVSSGNGALREELNSLRLHTPLPPHLPGPQWEGALAHFKARLASGEDVFGPLIRRFLLENPHRVSVTLLPDGGMAARAEQEERAKVEAFRQKLSEAEVRMWDVWRRKRVGANGRIVPDGSMAARAEQEERAKVEAPRWRPEAE
eukprot:353756-Chlamydomonas_euryale.AAC.2